jgi:tRNA(fMet)-specific endonuclease VapC
MSYLLDTNICIHFIRNKDLTLKRRIQSVRSSVFLSSITVAELWYGVFRSSKIHENAQNLQIFLSKFEILPFGSDSAWIYGQLLAAARETGNNIGTNDLLIASQAIESESIVVTNNEKEFSRIKDLKIENWIDAKK